MRKSASYRWCVGRLSSGLSHLRRRQSDAPAGPVAVRGGSDFVVIMPGATLGAGLTQVRVICRIEIGPADHVAAAEPARQIDVRTAPGAERTVLEISWFAAHGAPAKIS